MIGLELLCAGLIAMLFGLALCFWGYKFFLFLLPIWGFFFGLWLGAQTIQALFGTGAFSTVTSWVVGFIVGAVFAVLSYLFYMVAVAIIAGSLGYFAAVGILLALGLQMGFLVWLIGIVAAIALAAVTLMFNLQKWVIIIATSLMGAGIIFGGIYVMFNPWTDLLQNPIRAVLSYSPFLMICAIVVAIVGIVVQYRNNRNFTLDSYNNWA
ncbi:MAG: hypothetical protein H6Q37_198 [Chloroflexi bacterium]|nr:hypothetical protein [Chloroflexota bacterium]